MLIGAICKPFSHINDLSGRADISKCATSPRILRIMAIIQDRMDSTMDGAIFITLIRMA